jgi:hypothetical protein
VHEDADGEKGARSAANVYDQSLLQDGERKADFSRDSRRCNYSQSREPR